MKKWRLILRDCTNPAWMNRELSSLRMDSARLEWVSACTRSGPGAKPSNHACTDATWPMPDTGYQSQPYCIRLFRDRLAYLHWVKFCLVHRLIKLLLPNVELRWTPRILVAVQPAPPQGRP
jgi:hypothetical protein